jgi:hypothetical protein
MDTNEKERVVSRDVVTPLNVICNDCKKMIGAGKMARKITTNAITGTMTVWYHLPLCPRDKVPCFSIPDFSTTKKKKGNPKLFLKRNGIRSTSKFMGCISDL